MPDGNLGITTETTTITRRSMLAQVKKYQHTPYLVWITVAFLVLTSALFINTFSPWQFIDNTEQKTFFLIATSLLWLPAILLFRDTPANFAHGPKPQIPIISICLIILVTAFVFLDTKSGRPTLELADSKDSLLWLLVATISLALVAMGWNAAVLSRLQHKDRMAQRLQLKNGSTLRDHRQDAEAISALVALLLLVAIVLLAKYAGRYAGEVALQSIWGIWICIIVVGIFGMVSFWEPLSNLKGVQTASKLGRPVAFLARPVAFVFSKFDTFLVKVVAPIAGMENRSPFFRYAQLITLLTCFCLLGYFLPPKVGIIACGFGIMLAISISRLWGWVEEDRALTVLTNFNPSTPFKTDMREDFRDETLLSFVFVFLLLPIMMKQANESGLFGTDMFSVPDGGNTFLGWLGFFGLELGKAIPIVDWSEIYQLKQSHSDSLITINNTAARHAVFISRVTIDLVLISALLQAISISNRNRQQKQLYNASTSQRAGLIDRLDSFVELAELSKAVEETLKSTSKIFDPEPSEEEANKNYFDLGMLSHGRLIDFRRYNPDRLLELHGGRGAPPKNPKKLKVRAFIAAIAHERESFSLASRIEILEKLVEKNRPEDELYAAATAVEKEGSTVDLAILRSIMLELRSRSGLKALKKIVIGLILKSNTPTESIDTLYEITGGKDRDKFQYTHRLAIEALLQITREHPSMQNTAVATLKKLSERDLGASSNNAVQNALAQLGRADDQI